MLKVVLSRTFQRLTTQRAKYSTRLNTTRALAVVVSLDFFGKYHRKLVSRVVSQIVNREARSSSKHEH